MMVVAHSDDSNVEVVPESAEVVDSVDVDLNDLFHNVVENEENEEDLAQVHKAVERRHISDQFDCSELERRNSSSSRGELQPQPELK